MKMKTFAALALAGFLMVGLTACEPGGGKTMSGDGRKRLSIINSYGEFRDYVIQVNGMTTASLAPEVAQSYGIVRSENRGLVNLVILKKSANRLADQPVNGEVSISAANLTGQLKNIALREIKDGSSIYYIGEVSVANQETINFDFDVRPAGSDRTLLVRFSHRFYTR